MRIYLSFLWLCLAPFVLSAGILVPIEVLRQATCLSSLPPADPSLPLSDWLEKYRASAQPGAFFQGSQDGCDALHASGDLAREPCFLAHAMRYLLETYPDIQKDTAGQRLLVFLLGQSAHRTTEATWHASDGFLHIMADVDFTGDVDAAHAILDMGGDTFLAHLFALQQDGTGFNHLSATWEIPMQDLIAIYARMNVQVGTHQLQTCFKRGFATFSVLRRVGDSFMTHFTRQSPFLVHQLDTYRRGSIQDAVVSTMTCWRQMEAWLTSDGHATDEIMRHFCEPSKPPQSQHQSTIKSWRAPQLDLAQHVFAQSCQKDDAHGTFEALVEEELKRVHAVEQDGLLHLSTEPFAKRARLAGAQVVLSRPRATDFHDTPLFLTPSVPYSQFGSALAFISTRSSLQLAVGAPTEADTKLEVGRGAVYMIPIETASFSRVGRRSIADQRLDVQSADMLFFGQSLVNLTIGGYESLAILSRHQIELFRFVNGTMQTSPFLTIRASENSGASDRQPIASQLSVFRHRGKIFLAVLAPWSGLQAQGTVYLFEEKSLSASRLLHLTQADRLFKGSKPYERLGLSLSYMLVQGLVVLGSDRRVSAYNLDVKDAALIFSVQDPSQQRLSTGFGSVSLSEGNFLYIASPDEAHQRLAQAGKVRVYHLARLHSSSGRSMQVPWTITLVRVITADKPTAFAHFGEILTAAGEDEGIYIGAPDYLDRGAVFYLPALVQKPRKPLRQRPIGFITELLAKWFPGPLYIQRQAEQTAHAARENKRSRSYQTMTRPMLRRGLRVGPLFNVTLAPCLLGYETGAGFGAAVVSGRDGLVVVGAAKNTGLGEDSRRAGRVFLYAGLQC